jgi:hypothetical protein
LIFTKKEVSLQKLQTKWQEIYFITHVTQSFFKAKYGLVKGVGFGNLEGFRNRFSRKTALYLP